MNNSKYKIICLDMFQTLVNIDARKDVIWLKILKGKYSRDLQDKYVSLVNKEIVSKFHTVFSKKNDFENLETIFRETFTEIFSEEDVKYCPIEATNIFIEEHNYAPMYEDTKEFISKASKKYELCLVSDADKKMVKLHVKNMKFDHVFISEEIKAYKGNPNGKMFKTVLNNLNVRPEDILHIGDSSSDICGADKLNINTCWINRHQYKKQFNITPKYRIETLTQLYKILDI